ncbi:hypothetical protein FB440_10328 [Vibrio crassostreae]|nr:hypothetical protein EDB62_101672 [Vibrio crassostreae]TCO03578.1 hypothetical protein EDB51_103271 [Vibrio crassostreae]TWD41986.1 hypothetical protein FB440_10328 [Vibrio crassostreae]TWD74293.1 hypothetical protein FB445_101674 [Vibrio crassostreae]
MLSLFINTAKFSELRNGLESLKLKPNYLVPKILSPASPRPGTM